MTKITKLTDEQTAKMSVYRDKWIAIGLSTDRIDQGRAKAAVELMYTCGGLVPPEKILFAAGPLEAVKMLRENGITDSVTSYAVYGSQEASWLSFYDFFSSECDVDLGSKLDGMYAVARECGWVSAYDDIAIIQDRPLITLMDDQNRLHCETGPAIEYADGLKVYSWHGTRVPAEWIEDKSSLTATTALTWDNMEQRRAACEIIGWAKVLEQLDAKVIDEDEDPMIGTLLEVNLPGVGSEMFLKVLCGTGRTFALPVPPDMKTALEANCWTYGFNQGELRDLEVRT